MKLKERNGDEKENSPYTNAGGSCRRGNELLPCGRIDGTGDGGESGYSCPS